MKSLLALTLVLWASGAAAQKAAAPHPADPAARVPAPKYESAFAGYAPYREEKPAPWRDVNDEVGKVRGHAGIFGGGQAQGAPKPSGEHKGH
jgi:hypothetical protein